MYTHLSSILWRLSAKGEIDCSSAVDIFEPGSDMLSLSLDAGLLAIKSTVNEVEVQFQRLRGEGGNQRETGKNHTARLQILGIFDSAYMVQACLTEARHYLYILYR
jgi:hypothetical protein